MSLWIVPSEKNFQGLYLFFPSPETRENEIAVALSEMATVISILLHEGLDYDHLVFLHFLLYPYSFIQCN